MRSAFFFITLGLIPLLPGCKSKEGEADDPCPSEGCKTDIVCTVDEEGNDTCPADDPCRPHRCDTASATCRWNLLDLDGDGFAPIGCGGRDCDDSDRSMNPGAPEECDGEDEDCDGVVDEPTTADCDPIGQSGCDRPAHCYLDNGATAGTVCSCAFGSGEDADPCSVSINCALGFTCQSDSCTRVCDEVDASDEDDCGGGNCSSLDGTEWGFCN